ncbi:MAG: type II secretion system protein GspK [Candidatus Omnitrophica bacterium]|nr:type II secretion system protein GspK [Candidatus Omnitrophota bacterium]
MKTKNGSILILTVWVLSFLTIFAIGIGSVVSSQLNLASYFKDRLTMYYLAKAGIERAIVELIMDKSKTYDTLNEDLTNNESFFKEIPLDMGYFSVSYHLKDKAGVDEVFYGAEDETSKININYAPVGALTSLLKTIGEIDEGGATDIANAIIDWRDEDIAVSPRGAEDDYYKSLSLPYKCKNGKFQILEELLLVKGMTPELFSKIKDLITVYGEGKTNINTASFSIFLALGLSNDFAERMIKFRQASDEKDGTIDDNIFKSVEDMRNIGPLFTEESLALNRLISYDICTVKSDVFRITSSGVLKKDEGRELSRTITCVLRRKDEDRPKILYWHEE